MKEMRMTIRSTIALGLLAFLGALNPGATAAEETKNKFPGTEAGATSLIKEFVKPGADTAALSKQLRPTAADLAAFFESDVVEKAASNYNPAWDAGQLVIEPKAGQTEVKMFSTTTDEMKSWTGTATEFDGGWKPTAPKLKTGLKIYRFKFLEPGKDLGVAFEGLVYINGNWRIFPKPWRAILK
jgi:hypothetical protein